MTFTLDRGTSALLVSMPHLGGELPPELVDDYLPRARR